MAMDATPPKEPRKIRLTRAEAYAIRLPSPRKKKMAFVLVGLMVLVILGGVLWHFQAFWLPYWLPAEKPEALAGATPPQAASLLETATSSAPERPAAELPEAPLDYLSAAVWEHPRFQEGVKLFNQALDAQHAFQRNPDALQWLMQAEENALQAMALFADLQPSAPADIPLHEYRTAARRLVVAGRQLARNAKTAHPSTPKPEAPQKTGAKAQPLQPGQTWRHPEFLAGAKLFNEALEQYKLFQSDKTRMDLLTQIEESCFAAANTFEALRPEAPEGVPLNNYITQCYRLISDCRRQNLEAAAQSTQTPFQRGTAGPSRRPALPAYQPP